MPLFYTGKGDKGKSYVGKKKVDKSCFEIETLGDLDEFNSFLGLIKSHTIPKDTKKYLHSVQEKLFIIQAQIAALLFKSKYPSPKIKKAHIKEIEKIIDALEKKIKPARKFIIPGETQTSAWLDYARALSRRVERNVLKIAKKTIRRSSGQEKISAETLAYLNRLSSLLFALARFETKRARKKEKHPTYK